MKNRSSVIAITSLILVNLWPIFGVYYLNWNVGSILVLYWMENFSIGFFNIFKILKAQKKEKYHLDTGGIRVPKKGLKYFTALFFIIHFGGVTLGHGLFVLSFASNDGPFSSALAKISLLIFPAILTFISHGISFVVNFIGKQEYQKVSPVEQMYKPYSRIIIFQLTVFAGGVIADYLYSPKLVIVFLIILKIIIDLITHIRERKGYEYPDIISPKNYKFTFGG